MLRNVGECKVLQLMFGLISARRTPESQQAIRALRFSAIGRIVLSTLLLSISMPRDAGTVIGEPAFHIGDQRG
ncbi:hypothetical protein EFR01_59640 [Sinorhizobium fredii]|nr:hypothetical protein EFR01_59640 [Sinorhizobium fredii]GLS11641.1 hypothetical protein GCM10007864_52720 [Sinorhizobium fredii]